MKGYLIGAALVFMVATTVALAGEAPEAVADAGCGCNGRVLQVPTVIAAPACSCAGRVTLSERRTARRAARANATATRGAFLDAARTGTLVNCAGNTVALPTVVVEPSCKKCK